MVESIKCLFKGEYALAESPLWNKYRKSLVFVGIGDKKVFEYKLEENVVNEIEFDEMVGTVALVDENTIIVAVKNNVIKVNLDTYEREILMTFDIADGMRFNDGKCDNKGRLWLGTLAIDKSIESRFETGELYSIDLEGNKTMHKDKLTVANGMDWDLDKNVMYFTDSYTKKIDAYDYDEEKGTISYKETKAFIPEGLGTPDGFTLDEEGMIWVAIWGGGCVLRINPQDGEILSRIEVEESNVTCCIFGGENLDTLYITTASDDKGNRGSLYEVKTNTKGKETNLCKGSWLACQL